MKSLLLRYLLNILQLICSPKNGWEDINIYLNKKVNESEQDPEQFLNHTISQTVSKCFMPMIIIASLSWILRMFIDNMDILGVVLHALTTFISFFVASYCTKYLLSFYLGYFTDNSVTTYTTTLIRLIIIYSISYLAIISIITNCIKVHIPLLSILPFYIAFIIWKGGEVAGISTRHMLLFVTTATISILGIYNLVSNMLLAFA